MEIILTSIEALFDTYKFAKEVILIIIGAIFGGVCTVIINNGAMRKQAKFNMQYRILSDEAENIGVIYKKIEAIEIELSFGTGETEPLKTEINEVQHLLLALNERLRNKRKFVRKYMSAVIVEESAEYVSAYTKILYTVGSDGIFDFKIIPEINSEKIAELRNLEERFRKLNNQMTEAMESIIEPGIFSRIKRKLRKPGMLIEECYAIGKIHRRSKKER